MNDAIKQRLVGGAVLIVLGAIFVPLILDGPPPGRFEDQVDPAESHPRGNDVVSFKPPPPPARVTLGEKQPPAPAPARVTAPKQKPHRAASAASGWIVQVGSFGSRTNADALVKRLRAKGFSASLDELSRRGGVIYRVYVGPLSSREKAKRTRMGIEALFGMKGLVRKNG